MRPRHIRRREKGKSTDVLKAAFELFESHLLILVDIHLLEEFLHVIPSSKEKKYFDRFRLDSYVAVAAVVSQARSE